MCIIHVIYYVIIWFISPNLLQKDISVDLKIHKFLELFNLPVKFVFSLKQ